VPPGYELVVEIDTSGKERSEAAALAAEYADAGTTWWQEPVWQLMYQHPGDIAPLRAAIAAGPLL
jgi:hypothetical protein